MSSSSASLSNNDPNSELSALQAQAETQTQTGTRTRTRTRVVRPTTFQVAPNVVIQVSDIYSELALSICTLVYLISLLLEYFLVLFTIPTATVINRPAICVNTDILTLYSVLVSVALMPLGLVILPNSSSYRSYLISTLLHFIALILNIISTVSLFQVKDPLLIKFSEAATPTDVTLYFQTLDVVILILSFISFIFGFMNTLIHGLAIYRIANRISRQKEEVLTIPLNLELEQPLESKFIESGEIHREIEQRVQNSILY